LKEGNTLRKRKQLAKLVKFETKKKGLDTRMKKTKNERDEKEFVLH
jgi:hypothetical protein